MNRLIKLEIYRFTHMKKVMLYVILLFGLLIFTLIMQYLGCLKDPVSLLVGGSSMIIMFGMMLIPAVSAYAIGQLYNKGRIGYYEIMAGNKISHIILSKVIFEGFLFGILSFIFCVGFYIVTGLCNGFGDLTTPWLRILLCLVEIFHVSFVTALLVMNVMGPGMAVALAYLRFVLIDSVGFSGIGYVISRIIGDRSPLDFLMCFSSLNRFQMIALLPDMNLTLILHIVIGFVVEFILWYVIAYVRFKKKMF